MSVTQDGPSPSPPPPAQVHGPTSSQPLQEGPQFGTLENRLAETGGASLDGAVRTAAPGVDGTARALLSPRYLCPGQGGPAHHGGGESPALPRAGRGRVQGEVAGSAGFQMQARSMVEAGLGARPLCSSPRVQVTAPAAAASPAGLSQLLRRLQACPCH